MLFTEPVFLFLFLPAVLILHTLLPARYRNLLLLGFSLTFYAWGESFFVLVMLASIAVNYAIGMALEKSKAGSAGTRRWLALGVAGNLLALAVFKYANFVVDNLDRVLMTFGIAPIALDPIHLPIGISFFTFQAITYIVDVHRGEVRAQKNILDAGLYISLFPQLIAGPIVRYGTVAADIAGRHIDAAAFAEGIRRFIIGMGKKMLIANPAAARADQIFALPAEHLTTPIAWLGISCYTIQIYFDFSGYSDMAIGLGRMLGFRFPENFNYPYIARSVTDFWRRWHISLSTWFRDYLYIPLGGNRVAPLIVYRNLLIVFLLCGLWHGASWNFVIWGLLHGAFLVVERVGLGRLLDQLPRFFAHVYTLLVVVIAWVFFRAETLPMALHFIACLFGLDGSGGDLYRAWDFIDSQLWIVMTAGIVGATPVLPWLRDRTRAIADGSLGAPRRSMQIALQAAGVSGLFIVFLAAITLVAADSYNPFIYFRF